MAYAQMLRERFPEITLHAEDLLLLEAFQIQYLPDRVAEKEFAILLRAYPVVHRYLVARCPSIAASLNELLDETRENRPAAGSPQAGEQIQEALWEIADLIIYNKYPELFDQKGRIHWDISEIASITSLEGKIVADVGAGSGRIAFLVSPYARSVFAIEPVTALRSFMKDKAREGKVRNMYVMDGTLDALPLPSDSLDVLITSNAIGWNLQEELKEIERVVQTGGHAIHLIHSDPQRDNPLHESLTSEPWHYDFIQDTTEASIKTRYYKRIQ